MLRKSVCAVSVVASLGMGACDEKKGTTIVKTEYKTVFWDETWNENPKDTLLDGATRVQTSTYRSGRALTIRCFKGAGDQSKPVYDIRYAIDAPLLVRLGPELEKAGAIEFVVSVDGTTIGVLEGRSVTHSDSISFLAPMSPDFVGKLVAAKKTIIAMPRQKSEKLDGVVEFGIAKLADHIKPVQAACASAEAPVKPQNPRKSPDEIIANSTRLIATDAKNAEAYRDRADAYITKQQYAEAVADFTTSIGLKDNDYLAYIGRASAYAELGELDKAIADYSKAIALKPTDGAILADRADIYKRMSAYDKAIADYIKATEVDPAQANQNHMRLGLVRFYKGDFKPAADDLLRAIERQDEPYAMLFRYLARARAGENAAPELEANSSRLKTKEWPFAVMELLKGTRTSVATIDAAKDDNERCEAHFYIGQWHLLKGERTDAERAFGEALKVCPKSYYEYLGAETELKRLRN